MNITATLRNAMLELMSTACNTGYLQFYSGSKPANGDAAATGTLIAECRFNADAFAAASSGSITANAITSEVAVAADTIGYCRVLGSDHTTKVTDLTVGVGTGEVMLSRLDMRIGEPVLVASCVVSIPA